MKEVGTTLTCDKCDARLSEVSVLASKPFHYTASGLKNVYLGGIKVFRCDRCELETPLIPHVASLHRAIARFLIQKSGRLSGEEIRFLRKNVGISAKVFASVLDIRPEYLSRVENGAHLHLGKPLEKLVRAYASAAISQESTRQFLVRHGKMKLARSAQSLFVLKNSHWQLAPAA